MKSVLKRAHKIRKQKDFPGMTYKEIMSVCLKLAWAEFKATNVTELPSHECKADYNEICFGPCCMGATGSRYYSR